MLPEAYGLSDLFRTCAIECIRTNQYLIKVDIQFGCVHGSVVKGGRRNRKACCGTRDLHNINVFRHLPSER